MSYNGAGVYSLPGAQLANGATVSASENNQFRNDVAAALNVAWTRDGQAPATANIPMGSHKFTGLAAGTGAGDSVRYEQVTSAVNINGGTISGVTLSSLISVDLPDNTVQTADIANGAVTSEKLANGTLASVYPVGSIYMNASNNTNPATLLGFGTWASFGAGRMLVGLDSGDSSFDTAGKTGGSKDAIVVSHTHTASVTDPGHYHTIPNGGPGGTGVSFGNTPNTTFNSNSAYTGISVGISTTGSSGTNANLQPYIVVYMWKRTA